MTRRAAGGGGGRRMARSSIWMPLALLAALGAAGCSSRRGEVQEAGRQLGAVRILSAPQGAVIDFDGTPRGETFDAKPLEIRGVPHGWHTIRATLPGRVPHVLEFNLERAQAEVRIVLSGDGYGRLNVRTLPPGGEVFVDSRYHGKAEPQIQVGALSYGEHSLWVRLEGHRQERLNILVERQIERSYHLFLTKSK
ncbi:MAG: PEGA domain-containing protein [Candidatus Tectomicrobia bacterium]|nr:PEGA domain-containing protein [Candidatus Tectomicrobia bacterium]